MANHLTPEELAKEMGMDRDEVIRICIEEGVPIYHGKIDKTLFQASPRGASGPEPPRPLPDRTELTARPPSHLGSPAARPTRARAGFARGPSSAGFFFASARRSP